MMLTIIVLSHFYLFSVVARLTMYLEFGFRLPFITITETKMTLDNNKYGCGVFIDLRKAFNTVNHEILLQKLDHYGICELAFSWFKSYLTDRSQFVNLNSIDSKTKNVTSGQGIRKGVQQVPAVPSKDRSSWQKALTAKHSCLYLHLCTTLN